VKKHRPVQRLPAINRHVPTQHLSLLTKPTTDHRIQKQISMKGVLNYLVVALALMALACSVASAFDPAPLQDFCVAVNYTSTDAGTYTFFFFLLLLLCSFEVILKNLDCFSSSDLHINVNMVGGIS
jgi:hypothetical protein